MSTRENIRLDDALRQEDQALSFSDQSLTPADWRENTKPIISGGLSAILLLAIAYVIYWQCSQTGAFASVGQRDGEGTLYFPYPSCHWSSNLFF